jgi:hypothetical protein
MGIFSYSRISSVYLVECPSYQSTLHGFFPQTVEFHRHFLQTTNFFHGCSLLLCSSVWVREVLIMGMVTPNILDCVLYFLN